MLNVFHDPNYRYEPKYVQYLTVNFTFNQLQGLNLMFKQCQIFNLKPLDMGAAYRANLLIGPVFSLEKSEANNSNLQQNFIV